MLEPTNRREELRNVDEFKMIGLQLKILDFSHFFKRKLN